MEKMLELQQEEMTQKYKSNYEGKTNYIDHK